MHYHQSLLAISMRVRILFRRPAVGRPSRVTQGYTTLTGLIPQNIFQIGNLAHASSQLQLALLNHADACRVIAPIFQSLQSIYQNRNNVLIPDIAHNPAHNLLLSFD